MESDNIISIVIRVRNAENDLQRCLNGLREQELPDRHKLEIIVVDNESKDNSVEIASRFGAIIVPLATQDFTWGKALNCGITKTTGAIVLILSADAYPANKNWVSEMTHPFENINVAAVYGRQMPRMDAPIDEIVRLKKTFGDASRVMNSIPENFSSRGGNFPVSNACAAIRKSIWEKMPYDESISGGEEGVWTYSVLSQGFWIMYQASACVYHSHNDSIFRSCWRHLELIRKNTELAEKKVNYLTYIHFILSMIKRRMIICFFSEVNWYLRLKGLLLLPCEVGSFAIAAWFFHDEEKAKKYRSFFWDK